MLPVRIHRRWSEKEFSDYDRFCRREIDKGAIPITPGIHKAEKAILAYAREKGAGMIILTEQGFPERFKPSGQRFELCRNGQLLLLAPWPDRQGRKSTAGYTEFHQMNDLAAAIASIPATARIAIKPDSFGTT